MRGDADQFIPYGAYVLCRNGKVILASPEVANGTARTPKKTYGGTGYAAGEWLEVDPIEGLGSRDLHAMVNLPIMEPVKLYLPAGKITEAEYQERLFNDFARAGIDRGEVA